MTGSVRVAEHGAPAHGAPARWLQRATASWMSQPSDAFEREADRVADAVASGATRASGHAISAIDVSRVQRQAPGTKSNEEKYLEAAKKAGEVFMTTEAGKKILEAAAEDPLAKGSKEFFLGTLPGKVITGATAVAVVTALAATGSELPMQIPEIPLDRWVPGLKVKLTYEGPVNRPTKAMITFSYGPPARKATTDRERYREETARIAAEQQKFRAGLRYEPGSAADLEQKAEEAAFRQAMASRFGQIPGVRPPSPSGQFSIPTLQLPEPGLGYRRKPIRLLDEELHLKPMTEIPSTEREREKEETEAPGSGVMRKASAPTIPAGAPGDVRGAVGSPGHALDASTRAVMEARIGHDFGDVRVHTDAAASRSARAIDSLAYTIGSDIAFAPGTYSPGTPEGRRLLAHELAHVAQQRSGAAHPAVQRKGGTFGGFFANIGRSIASIFVDEPGYSDATLKKYLAVIDAGDIEDDFDSDDKARIVVRRWMAGATGYDLSKERKVQLLREMIVGPTGNDDEAAMLNLLAGSPDDQLTYIFSRVSPATLREEIHHTERTQLEHLLAGWSSRTGAVGKADALAATHAVTQTEKAFVESKLTPGATLAPAAPVAPGVAPPPPVVVPPPAMTGLPPAPGVAGGFETGMTSAMKTYLGARGGAFRTLKAAGPPAFPIQQAKSLAVSAQQETEAHFAPLIRVASRAPADVYHPGSYSLTSQLGDQSAVPITDAGIAAAPGVTPRPGRIGWMGYWMKQPGSGGKAVMDTYHCVPSLRPADETEFNRVRNKIATDPVNRTDIDDTIHGWPAEATGGVNIQPYVSGVSPRAMRINRWDLFTTLIHEMMHVLQHPNFKRTYTIIGGTAMEILKEGMADVMRHDLWDGPGQLEAKLSTPALAPVRRQVEGADLPYDKSVVKYHADYPDAYPKAREIVDGAGGYKGVGIANAKAAFFLGHTELLGIGAGTATSGGLLAGVGSWRTTESENAEVIVARAGDTETKIRTLTGAPAGGVRDATPPGAAIAAGAALAAGRRVRVPGIRHTYALNEDTLGSIAAQHGVTVADLVRANRLPPATPATDKPAAGTRLLIPRRGP
jgi:hypothetical protein